MAIVRGRENGVDDGYENGVDEGHKDGPTRDAKTGRKEAGWRPLIGPPSSGVRILVG